MISYRVPFNKPFFIEKSFQYIRDAMEKGNISGNGIYTLKCHSLLKQLFGIRKAMLTTSCTHALEMCALLLDVQPGDEVIVPSFTFVSTINAFVLRGAKPVFIDVRSDTLNMNERLLERLINSRTKAIVPVHYAGVGCEMDVISSIAASHNIPVVEDNAQGIFGKYRENFLGTFGCLSTHSFHETKNFSCGEGGALFINDPQYIERAEILWEKGTNRNRFFRGEVDKYTWVDLGSSYLPSDILAAFLYAQLEDHIHIQLVRKKIWEYYFENLKDWASNLNIGLPFVPVHCDQSYHMFYLLLPSFNMRQSLINYLKGKSILSVFHYVPLHLSEMGQRFGGKLGDCPVTEDVSIRLLRLPFYNSLTTSDQRYAIEALKDFNGE